MIIFILQELLGGREVDERVFQSGPVVVFIVLDVLTVLDCRLENGVLGGFGDELVVLDFDGRPLVVVFVGTTSGILLVIDLSVCVEVTMAIHFHLMLWFLLSVLKEQLTRGGDRSRLILLTGLIWIIVVQFITVYTWLLNLRWNSLGFWLNLCKQVLPWCTCRILKLIHTYQMILLNRNIWRL